jgi:hypothetical protein
MIVKSGPSGVITRFNSTKINDLSVSGMHSRATREATLRVITRVFARPELEGWVITPMTCFVWHLFEVQIGGKTTVSTRFRCRSALPKPGGTPTGLLEDVEPC